MTTFSKSRVPAISEHRWSAVARFLVAGTRFMPGDVADASGLSKTAALSLMIGLYEEQHANLLILVYHCAKKPVAVREFACGFQPTPWLCWKCEKRAEEPNALTYEFEMVMRENVELVP